jgi:predicted dehydrogenase
MNSTTLECKVAVVGAGYMAGEHLRALASHDAVRLVGIQSRTRGKADTLARKYAIPTVCDTLEALYETTRPDLVVVTVNAQALGAVVTDCCRFPWTILAEKPVGLDCPEARQVERFAAAAGARVFVALNRRFYAATRHVLAELAGNPEPRFIEVFDQQTPELLLSLGKNPKEIEKLMYANSIHVIDYFAMFGRGEIVSVRPLPPEERTALATVATVRFSSGDVGVYHGLWDAPGPWAAAVTTASRRWEMRPLESAAFQDKGTRTLNKVELDPVDTQFKPGLRVQAAEAVKAAMGLESASVPLEAAGRTMELVARIYGHSLD